MTQESKRFAKAVLLGQRIFLNNQAMLTSLQRTTSLDVVRGRETQGQKLRNTLDDLSTCLNDFETVTGIELAAAKETLALCYQSLEQEDVNALYSSLQKLYRDDYLGVIIALSK